MTTADQTAERFPFGGVFRWAVVPILFGLGGAVGGAADALLSEFLIHRYGDEWVYCGWIGGGIGLGVGTALSVFPWPWLAVPAAVPLGVIGYVAMSCMAEMKAPRFGWSDIVNDDFFPLAAPAAPVLVLAHLLYLRWGRGWPLASALGYALLGALSGSVFWWRHEFAMGLLNGAVYGLFQFAAMRAAQLARRQEADTGA
jgi:hypothetical protein